MTAEQQSPSAAEQALARRVRADMLIEHTATELRTLLHQVARELRPFPMFPESSTPGIEAEPGAASKAEYGCIILCPDGELYEFTMSLNFGTEGNMDITKQEDTREVRMPPQDYISYAYNALKEATRILVDRMEGRARV